MSEEKPIIAVCGGVRGLQGGSVVDYILRDGVFTPRALTRDVECAQARGPSPPPSLSPSPR